MKVTVNMDELQGVIKKVKKVISGRTNILILKNMLIEAENETVKVRASDLENTLEIKIESGKVIEPGKTLIDAETLLFLEKLRGKTKQITIAKNKINYDNKVIEHKNENDVEDFPGVVECNDFVFSTNQKELKRLLSVSYVCNRKEKYCREITKAICIDGDHFVATDTYRLAKRKHDIENKLQEPVLLPIKSVDLLDLLLSDSENKNINCYISEDKGHLCFEFDNIKHTIFLIQERYFPWRDIDYPEPRTSVFINVKEALEELKLLYTIVSKSDFKPVKLQAKNNILKMIGKHKSKSLTVEFPVKDRIGEEMDYEVILNCQFLIDALEQCREEYVRVDFAWRTDLVVIGEDCIIAIKLNQS